jgi:tetratricopeptide (TPR) repeat protein
MEYNLNSLFTLRFDQAPGLVMEALSTIGVLGTIAYLVLTLSFIGIGIYLLSSGRSRNKVYSLGLFSTSVMFFVASFMSAFNGSIVLLSALIGMLAMVSLFWESGVEDRFLSLSLKASPKFALALAFIFMVVSAGVAFLFVFIGKVFVADIAAGRSFRSETVSEDSVRVLSQAVRMYPWEPQYRVQLGQQYIALANMEASKPSEEGDIDLVVGYIRQAIDWTESARSIAPNDVLVAESLGLVYENGALYASEALPKALESYEAASRLEPNSPVLPVKIGQIKRAMGEREKDETRKNELFSEARDRFREAVGKKENFPVGYYNLAVALSRLGDYTGAIDELSKAVGMEPSNITYLYSLGSLYQLRNEGDDLETAKSIYVRLLDVNERLVDVRLALGLLYEGKGESDAALAEYRKILEYLPENEQNAELREQVEAFMEGIESGRGNITSSDVPELPEPESGDDSVVPLQTEDGLTEQEEEIEVETVPAPEIPSVEEGD